MLVSELEAEPESCPSFTSLIHPLSTQGLWSVLAEIAVLSRKNAVLLQPAAPLE